MDNQGLLVAWAEFQDMGSFLCLEAVTNGLFNLFQMNVL